MAGIATTLIARGDDGDNGDAEEHRPAGLLPEVLAVLEEHARTFPRGRLADEREAMHAATLCRREATDDGLARATAWFTGRADASALATVRVAWGCLSSSLRRPTNHGDEPEMRGHSRYRGVQLHHVPRPW